MTEIKEKQLIPKQYWSDLFQYSCSKSNSNWPESKRECAGFYT